MEHKLPMMDYSGQMKEPLRKSAKWHFERKPYGVGYTEKQKAKEESEEFDK